MQHYGTDKVGWMFAPVVLLWFLIIGGIGIFNIWKYDTSVLKAFSPLYIYHYLRRGRKEAWISLGGIMLSITGSFFTLKIVSKQSFPQSHPCLILSFSHPHFPFLTFCISQLLAQSLLTGTEALFADLAHFPLSAIQLAFTVIVFPCLLLAYIGQAAYLTQHKDHVAEAFYRSIPGIPWFY